MALLCYLYDWMIIFVDLCWFILCDSSCPMVFYSEEECWHWKEEQSKAAVCTSTWIAWHFSESEGIFFYFSLVKIRKSEFEVHKVKLGSVYEKIRKSEFEGHTGKLWNFHLDHIKLKWMFLWRSYRQTWICLWKNNIGKWPVLDLSSFLFFLALLVL